MNSIDILDRSVPVSIAARVYGKDANWIRAGLITGYLPIGIATRNSKQIIDISEMNSKLGRINYFISAKKLYEETGYEYSSTSKNL